MIRRIKTTLTCSTAALLFAVLTLFALAAPVLVHNSPDVLTYESITADAVAHYKLDENTTVDAADSGTGGNDGTHFGGLDPAGDSAAGLHSGTALHFDGTDDYITATAAVTAYPFTISGWVKKDAAPASVTLFSLSDTPSAAKYMSVYLTTDPGNLIGISRRNTTAYDTLTALTVGEGESTNVVGVFVDATSVDVYVAGVKESLTGLTSVSMDADFNKIVLGSLRVTLPGVYMDGVLDDVLLFDRALSAAEVAVLATAPDSTAPTVASASVDSAGTTLTVTFDENIRNSTGITIDADVTTTAALSSPSVSGDEITYTISPAIQSSDTVDIDYAPGNITDSVGNALASFSNTAVTNNSSQSGVAWLIDDDFEGGGSSDWDGVWSVVTPSGASTSITTTEAGAPTGGGSSSYRQHWSTAASGSRTSWLRYNFASAPVEDDILEWDFWFYEDPSFSIDGPSPHANIKMLYLRGADSEIVVGHAHPWNGDFSITVQNMPTPNVNRIYTGSSGGVFFTNGTWHHIRIEVKLSQPSGSADGYIHCWIDDVQRINQNSIHTYESGDFDYFQLESTVNDFTYGDDQKRYFDTFKFRVK